MPKFDVSSVADVEYDLTGVRGVNGEFIQDKGVVPEPSRKLVGETMKRISAAYNENVAKQPDEEIESTPDAVAEAMQKLEDEDFEAISDALLEAIVDFCQGHPSRESIEQLPWPRFIGFFGFIMENMLSPEASKPDKTKSTQRLRSV